MERTEKPIYGMFTAEEKTFLQRMFVVYPKIGENFDRYLGEPSMPSRLFMLQRDLQGLKRAGWVRRGIRNPESVAEHSVVAARMSLAFAPPGMDTGKLIEMLMFHDAPEAIVSDFTPHDSITEDDKHQLESLAGRTLFPERPEVARIVQEYIDQKTPLSHFAHDIDKLDAVVTALMYEGMYPAHTGKLYRTFADWTAPKLKTEEGKALGARIEQESDAMRTQWRAETRAQKPQHNWSR